MVLHVCLHVVVGAPTTFLIVDMPFLAYVRG